MHHNRLRPLGVFLAILLGTTVLQAQAKVTSPKEEFGFNIGDDYVLANYSNYEKYIQKLGRESDRVSLQMVGKSSEGRPMYLVVVTSPENQKKLDRYKQISRQLAQAEGLTEQQARALATEGKAVVWIDGGIHADEVLGAQQLIEMIYQMASRTDAETMRLLNDDIMLFCLINPDGMELVSNWYMREPNPANRSLIALPELYNKYAGHDDNRDFYMVNLSESDAINHVLYRDWFPEIMYNHHQTGPAGTVMFSPPFRDPFNFNFDPLIISELDEVASAIHSRMIAENKPGVTMRTGANYSTWYNGGLRTTTYFHNMIGILTETIGSPTPEEIPLVFRQQLPRQDLPMPIAPQVWHFRQSIDYSITANRATLDWASRNKDTILYNYYVMGKNSIARGNRDSWTISPHRIDGVQAAAQRPSVSGDMATEYWDMMHDPKLRDPRGYIVPSDQPDFLTAIKFLNTLIKNGVQIQQATAAFAVAGKTYPAGSYVVKTNQAYRPHILDMFEPQDHPDDFAYPGAPPTRPYDNTGWTLAYQMAVKFDRILDGFDCPCRKLPVEELKPATGKITQVAAPAGYLLRHEMNDSFIALNRLLSSGENVYSVKAAFSANGKSYPAGTQFIPAKATTLAKLQRLAADTGLSFDAAAAKPPGEALMLHPMRVGLWDQYGGSMTSGWTRMILERFEFPFQVVYPPTLDAGNLSQKFDVLIFPDGGIPSGAGRVGGAGANIPADLQSRVGSVTAARTIPQLKKFMDDGGTILVIGGSHNLAYQTGVPVTNALADIPAAKFYVPGSILQARVDNTNPLAWGIDNKVDMFFDNSPAFTLKPGAKAVAWFDSATPLRSGWGWGQSYLQNSVAVAEAQVGKGKMVMFGPEILFRGQPHGTFKFLFNGIYYGRTETVNLNRQ